MSTINTNIQALTTAMSLDRTQELQSNAITQLSSGSSLVGPGADAAALGDTDSLDADNSRLSAASTNIQNTLSYTQSADGYLGVVDTMLSRMSELSADAKDPTKDTNDVANYQAEFKSLQDELRSIVGGSAAAIGGTGVNPPVGTFNGTALFGSTAAGGLTVQIGDSSSQQLTIPDINLQTGSVGSLIQQDSSGNYLVSAAASGAQADIAGAQQQVSDGRSTLGAAGSRLSLTASSLVVEQQNNASAISSLSDVDVAMQSTQLAKYNILAQASASMLAQANLSPQSVLKLIKAA
jgi:flagellin